MQQPSVFEYFKRHQSFESKITQHENIYFRIDFDEFGAFLQVVDKNGKEVEVSFLNYDGKQRTVLKLIEQILDRSSYLIDWEKPNEQLYLGEHEYLLEQLRFCPNVVGPGMQALAFSEIDGKISFHLRPSEREEFIESEVVLEAANKRLDDFRLISARYLLAENQLIPVPNLGSNYRSLLYFNARVSTEELTVFLSLLFSNIEDVRLVYSDYKVERPNASITADPCLIFEKIDEDDSLFMRIGQVLPNMEVGVLDQFDLSKYAEINDLEKLITVKFIERDPLESIVEKIGKLLKKQKPSGKKSDQPEVVLEKNLFIIPKDIAAGFIYEELPELLLTYQVFGAEKLKSYKISTAMPSVSLNLSHNIDFFEGDVSLDFDGESINLFDVINQYKKNRYVKLNDGTHALINEQYIRKLERLFNKKGKKARVSFFDLPLVEEIIEEKVAHTAFEKSRDFFRGLNKIDSRKAALPEVKAELRPYQKQGYKWLQYLHDYKLGGCLADDMGLGKTLQCIAMLAHAYEEENPPSLIVMPRSLLHNWEREIKRFAPQLTTSIFYGPNRNLEESLQAHLLLSTYAIVRNEIENLKEFEFHYVVLDESQNIKNINAQTTKAVMLLNSTHRLALSGTPIENNLGELYSLFRFLNPSMFGTLNQFNQNYLAPIQKYSDDTAIRQLRKKIYPFVLRRLKKDVLKDLPDKIEQTLFVELSDGQRKLYEQRRQFYQMAINQQIADKGLQQSRFFVFQALNELRQIASIPEQLSDGRIESPKLELLIEHLLDAIANGHKALIFVNYLAAIESISEKLDEAGIDFVTMSGATRNRQELVDRFQNDARCQAFVMTLKTGGTGLNLTAADTIFIFDPWWNVAAENQAIDRAHRIGQTNKVIAYKLIVQNTIEEKILELQQLKKELFDNVITSDSASLKSLSEEDINFILGNNA